MTHDTTRVRHWQKQYVDGLRNAGWEVVEPDSTPFVYVRTPGGQQDKDWVEQLLERTKVLAIPAPCFHHHGWFRLAVTASDADLAAALERIEHLACD